MKKFFYYSIVLTLLAACSMKPETDSGEIVFIVDYPATKASNEGFNVGDRLSLWAVEQDGAEHVPLQIGGNFINNEALVYDGTKWMASQKLYWSTQPCNFYALYPYNDGIFSIEEQPVSVRLDQDTAADGDVLSGYEASDLLYASASGVSRSDGAVRLQFKHMLSKLTVKIVKGEQFEGEIPDDIVVHIYNTLTSGVLNLAKGSVVTESTGNRSTVVARKDSNTEFDAILMPQNIESRTPLVEVTMGGIAYLLEYSLSLRPGYHHTIYLTVNTSPDQEKITIEIDPDVNDWE